LKKYLQDSKGRVLTFEEIQRYPKIGAVLKETMEIMNEMDTRRNHGLETSKKQ